MSPKVKEWVMHRFGGESILDRGNRKAKNKLGLFCNTKKASVAGKGGGRLLGNFC